jgi:lipopolysaccharide/colanic/teichoic acid biosynthesis glycosyltransferase
MLKFRKFHWDAAGHPLTMSDDDRFTPIGRFLAVTKLDELPQLWNVLRGDMRLVGPRPEDPEFVSCYPEHYRQILKVVPGITGPAALEYAHESHLLRGHKDPIAFYRTELLPRKVAIDLAYAEKHSVGGDIAILAKTAILPTKQAIRRVWFTSHHPHAPLAAARHARRVNVRAVVVAATGVLLLVSFALASSVQL